MVVAGKVIRNKSDVGTMCLGLDCDSDEPQQMEVHEGMVGRRSMIWGGSLDPDGISKCGKLFDTIAMSRCLGDHDKAWMKPVGTILSDRDRDRDRDRDIDRERDTYTYTEEERPPNCQTSDCLCVGVFSF